jgi:hypothetical protein
MPSIDERVVAMAFENAKFETNLAKTMVSLAKLDTALQSIGSKNSLGDIEKAASKISLAQPMSALDKLKAKFSNAGSGAAQGFSDIDKAGNKVTLEQPINALNKVQAAVGSVGARQQKASAKSNVPEGDSTSSGFHGAISSVSAQFRRNAAAIVAFGTIVHRYEQGSIW